MNKIYIDKKIKFCLCKNKRESLHTLSHQILCYSNNNIPRINFLREISEMLLKFFECDSVKLWLKKDGNKVYPSLQYQAIQISLRKKKK